MFNSTVGQADSNSYVSVEQADEFFAASVNTTGWPTVLAEKQTALQEATRVLDEQFQWGGEIASDTQSLGWPRTGAYDHNARLIPSTIIPKRVADATCYLALFLVQNGGLSQDSIEVKGLKVGPLDLKFENKSVTGTPPYIVKMLEFYGYYYGHATGGAYSVKALRC